MHARRIRKRFRRNRSMRQANGCFQQRSQWFRQSKVAMPPQTPGSSVAVGIAECTHQIVSLYARCTGHNLFYAGFAKLQHGARRRHGQIVDHNHRHMWKSTPQLHKCLARLGMLFAWNVGDNAYVSGDQ